MCRVRNGRRLYGRGARGCGPGPAGRGRSAAPPGPGSGRVLSSCRARTASRGSRDRGTPRAAGIRRKRTAAFVGILEKQIRY